MLELLCEPVFIGDNLSCYCYCLLSHCSFAPLYGRCWQTSIDVAGNEKRSETAARNDTVSFNNMLESIAETCGLLPHKRLKHANMLMNLMSLNQINSAFPFRRSDSFAVFSNRSNCDFATSIGSGPQLVLLQMILMSI